MKVDPAADDGTIKAAFRRSPVSPRPRGDPACRARLPEIREAYEQCRRPPARPASGPPSTCWASSSGSRSMRTLAGASRDGRSHPRGRDLRGDHRAG